MKPFDITLWKQGKPVQTRDGVPVPNDCIAHMPGAPIYQILYRHPHAADFADPIKCNINGNADKQHYDLVMAPTKRIVWVNLYPDSYFAGQYPTQEMADKHGGPHRLGGRAYPVEVDTDD